MLHPRVTISNRVRKKVVTRFVTCSVTTFVTIFIVDQSMNKKTLGKIILRRYYPFLIN